MKADLSLLRAGLTQFGLNPAHWMLEAKASLDGLTHFELQRRSDGAVMFEGWASGQGWLSLGIAIAVF
jgi:hypothetical protein